MSQQPFSSNGGFVTPGNVIANAYTADPNEAVNVQALFDDNNVGSSLHLDPNNTLTRLQGWSDQSSNSWTTADWATGVYTTQSGGTIGAIEFTGAPTMISYIDSLPSPDYVYFQVNGGPLLASQGWGGDATNITFYVAELPATDPTTITNFTFYYNLSSIVEMDYDSGTFDIAANGLDITLETRGQNDIDITSARSLGMSANGSYTITNNSTTDSISIVTDSNGTPQTWSYGNTGILRLPGEGVLQSFGDSVTLQTLNSGSGNANSVYLGTSGGLGFNDQSIGGNWLEIFRNGAEPEIRVPVGRGNLNIQTAEANVAYNWVLDNTGNLTLPGNTFAVNYANGTPVSISGGGSGNTISNGTSNVTIPTANANVTVNVGEAAYEFSDTAIFTLPNGLTIGTPSGDANINTINSLRLGATNNVAISSNSLNWTFGTDGSTTFGSAAKLTGSANEFTLDSSTVEVVNLVDNTGTGFYTDTNQFKIQANTAYVWSFDSTGNLRVPSGDTQIKSFNATGSSISLGWENFGNANVITRFSANSDGAYVATVNNAGDSYQWQFDPTGNLTLPGNTFAVNYANGTPVTFGGGGSGNAISNGTSNVSIPTANGDVSVNAANLTASGNISAVGNIFGANLILPSGASLVNDSNVTVLQNSTGNAAVNVYTDGSILVAANSQLLINIEGNSFVTMDNRGIQVLSNLTAAGGEYSLSGWDTVSGNNISAFANINAISGNVNAAYLYGDGSNITGISSGSSIVNGNSNVIIATANSNITMAVGGSDAATFTDSSVFFNNVRNDTGNTVNVMYYNTSTSEITFGPASASTYGNTQVSDYLSSGTVATDYLTSGNVSATGNITATNLYATSVVSAAGNVRGGNINTAGDVSATGNITATGLGSNLVRRAYGIAGSNTAVTLDNIQAMVGGTPIRLYVNTVTGSLTGTGATQTLTSGTAATSSWTNVPIGAGAGNAFAMSGALTSNGDTAILNLADQDNGTGMWRITGMIANTTANLYGVTIERLV